jgi:RNA polymerase sigma factor (sigma-70 family)
MASASVHPVIRFIRRLTEADPTGEPGDGQLLARFAGRRDEAAFATLLQRHGPMVYGVCRRILGDGPDVDDAFQATFLVLVRKAGSIGRPDLLGNWLYGVAYRTALKARASLARRRAELQPLPEVAVADPTAELVWRDLRPILDEELNRLPDKYRTAVVLCDLEGRTHAEAAQSLGCPRATVTTRLTRAHARLRSRLVQRGLTLSAGLLTTVLAERAAPAAPPLGLANFTLQAAVYVAAGQAAAAVVSPQVAALTGGVLRAMFWSQLTRTAVLLLAVCLFGGGARFLTYRALAGERPAQEDGKAGATERPAKPAEPAAGDRENLQGTWKVVSSEWMGHPDKKRMGEVWAIAGNQIAIGRDGPKAAYTYHSDAAADPKHIDLAPMAESEVGYHYCGIYRLEKDRLTLCATVVQEGETGPKVRPTAFATQAGDLRMLLVLERQPRPGNGERGQSDREKLQGTWVVVSGERDGTPLPESEARGRMTFTGDEFSFAPSREKIRVTYKLDPARKPKGMTMTAQEGKDKGRDIPWVYELTGNRLKLCWDTKEGKKRPTAFATQPESGLMLVVLRRAEPGDEKEGDGPSEPEAPAEAPEKKPDPARDEQAKLQGTWVAVSAERGGQKAPAAQIKSFTVVIKGDRITFNPDTENRVSTFELDPSKDPKEIDLTPQDGPRKGRTSPGIYSLEGDVLKLCSDNGDGQDRPRAFATQEGTNLFVLILKRAAEELTKEDLTPPTSREARDDWDKLQGTWTAVAAEQDHQKVPEEAVREISIAIRGNRIIIRPSRQPTRVTFQLDPTRKPRILAMTAQEGPDKGKSVPGIYDVQGDRLQLCFAAKPDAKAPAQFATTEGSGLMLLVLKRGTSPVEEERAKLQGTWQVVSGETNGAELPEDVVKGMRLTFDGNKLKLVGRGEGGEASYTLDPSQKPKTLDLRVSDQEGALGIYELDGDKLRLCMVEPNGLTRPTEFAGKDKAVLLVLKRLPARKQP